MTVAVSDGGDIDSALILGERPRSSASGAGSRTPVRTLEQEQEQQGGDEEGLGSPRSHATRHHVNEDPAAVTLHTAVVYHPTSSPSASASGSSALSSAHRALASSPRREAAASGSSSVNNLAALTTATLSSVDSEGNPLINQSEFLLQLDHQLQTIETCVHEATAM